LRYSQLMEHHKIVKTTLCSVVRQTSGFPIFLLSNIHERNPNQKASKQPQITDKKNSEDRMPGEEDTKGWHFSGASQTLRGWGC